jgi:sortase B
MQQTPSPKNSLHLIPILFFGSLLVFSVYKLVLWGVETHQAQEQANSLRELMGNEIGFDTLRGTNPDTVAWIKVPGTAIDYPVVQSGDNNYYLNRTFDKEINQSGWIFGDYRNNFKNLDQNTIIYGHGLLNQIMFGSLKNTLKESWYNNRENHLVELTTENQKTKWQVFSTYKISSTTDYLQIKLDNQLEYSNFLQKIRDRSIYDYKVDMSPEEKIITLSTCANKRDRIVLHAKLISVIPLANTKE